MKQQKLSKRLLSNDIVQFALTAVLASYIRFIFAASKKHWRMDPLARPYMLGDRNALFAFWHGRMLMMPCICPPKRNMHVMISHHLDGELIARTMKQFHFGLVRGSTKKGGAAAAIGAVNLLKNGDNVCMTPDGPRGPFQTVSAGTITVAKLSGKPIIPVTFAASSGKRFRSWDRFLLPHPFGTLALYIGEPITIPPDADNEQMRQLIENAMIQLTAEADQALDS